MAESTERIIEVMQELIDAHRLARDTLGANEEVLVAGLEAIRSGAGVVETLEAAPANAQRRATQEMLERLVAARHQFRLYLIGACIDAGMSPREIAADWGISRQRVDQFVQEFKRVVAD